MLDCAALALSGSNTLYDAMSCLAADAAEGRALPGSIMGLLLKCMLTCLLLSVAKVR